MQYKINCFKNKKNKWCHYLLSKPYDFFVPCFMFFCLYNNWLSLYGQKQSKNSQNMFLQKKECQRIVSPNVQNVFNIMLNVPRCPPTLRKIVMCVSDRHCSIPWGHSREVVIPVQSMLCVTWKWQKDECSTISHYLIDLFRPAFFGCTCYIVWKWWSVLNMVITQTQSLTQSLGFHDHPINGLTVSRSCLSPS